MKQAFKAFVRAWGWGTLAGSGPFLLVTVPGALSFASAVPAGDPGTAINLAVFPLLLGGAITLAGMVLIGLPLTAILRYVRGDRKFTYQMVGGLSGFLLPIIFLELSTFGGGAYTLVPAIPGALAGFVAGSIWGGWRESVANKAGNGPETCDYNRGERWLR